MKARRLTLVAAAIMLHGCASEQEPAGEVNSPAAQTASAAPVDPTTTPQPTKVQPRRLTIKQAADRYLDLVAASNAAGLESDGLLNAGRYREACEVLIDPSRKLIKDLAAERWPGDVDRVIRDQFIPFLEDETKALESCASAADDRAAEDIYWGDVTTAAEARYPASSAVRTLLNLPQVGQ